MAHQILSPVQRVPTLESMNIDRDPEALLHGARDLIRECQELLRGECHHLTPREDYLRGRLAYWRARAEARDQLAA